MTTPQVNAGATVTADVITSLRAPSVLVTTPALDEPGGVANFFRILRGHLPKSVTYFTVGSRSGTKG